MDFINIFIDYMRFLCNPTVIIGFHLIFIFVLFFIIIINIIVLLIIDNISFIDTMKELYQNTVSNWLDIIKIIIVTYICTIMCIIGAIFIMSILDTYL